MNIQSFKTLFPCLLLFLLSCQVVYPQDRLEARKEFDRIAENYNLRYKSLMRTRGIHWSELPVSSQTISAGLEEWYGMEKVGVLFYYHELDTLRTWLIDQDGIRSYVKQSISENQLLLMEKQLKRALRVSTQSFSRAPKTRGARVMVQEAHTQDGINIIDTISHLLLPEKISVHIPGLDYLIIVPTHNLGTIPFAMLKPINDESYLIDHLAYSIAPNLEEVGNSLMKYINDAYMSGNEWREQSHPYFGTEDTANRFQTPLIIGNPAYSNKSGFDFPQLPGAEKEVKLIAGKIYDSLVYINEEATIDLVREKAPTADLLYFATHGVSSHSHPLDSSFLAFAPGEDSQGFWSAREIQFTPLSARLAVLSACQTGLGGAHNAGIIGLTRAFQIAGVDHVIMSLWNVNDEATADLMVAFIRELENSVEFIPAVALRKAILQTREKWPNPAHWSSFVVFGIPY